MTPGRRSWRTRIGAIVVEDTLVHDQILWVGPETGLRRQNEFPVGATELLPVSKNGVVVPRVPSNLQLLAELGMRPC
eukprot:CAMPEP_0177254688 /NCGR_PEP_ID=MMETSP0367-20130122/55925_1 /TAXON_ID=447022 ORGANISM="Scrippsiella hangoei-like, Strain SHHI-4" /NCGR_SAMPLE_ID=MMETSP0367 /ASSEMBLY_ACC=CAM_ASM_000362 /LENGTH=76 /DNA_ID=CAMNT_0018708289 /DNA_START=59 /DNA_END=289 /DNA_ORIENTATION=-